MAAAATVLLDAASASSPFPRVEHRGPRYLEFRRGRGQPRGRKVRQIQDRQIAGRARIDSVGETGLNLTKNGEERIVWLEVLKAINECCRSTPKKIARKTSPCANRSSLRAWDARSSATWRLGGTTGRNGTNRPSTKLAPTPADADAAEGAEEASGPTGEGWVFRVTGFHFHNQETPQPNYSQGAQFVRETLLANLWNKKITLPRSTTRVKRRSAWPTWVSAIRS